MLFFELFCPGVSLKTVPKIRQELSTSISSYTFKRWKRVHNFVPLEIPVYLKISNWKKKNEAAQRTRAKDNLLAYISGDATYYLSLIRNQNFLNFFFLILIKKKKKKKKIMDPSEKISWYMPGSFNFVSGFLVIDRKAIILLSVKEVNWRALLYALRNCVDIPLGPWMPPLCIAKDHTCSQQPI